MNATYILKNALKCIGRSKGRNILIGVIVFVISAASCVGLSIRQAAENAKADTMDTMTVTATISFDRASMMSQFAGGMGGQGFDRTQFANLMGGSANLTLDEYLVYAGAGSVQDFTYSMTAYINGADGFLPVSAQAEDGDAEPNTPEGAFYGNGFGGMGGAMGGQGRIFGLNSDFTIVGYSGEGAMTSFLNGTASIIEGAMFDAAASDGTCLISQELAVFNGLSVGDAIALSNPNNEEERYELTVSGIYADSSANTESFSMFGATASDPANRILVSYPTLAAITETSEQAADGEDASSPITGTLAGVYTFADVESYEAFEPEARALGLPETYNVTSADAGAYGNSLTPLNTLSTMAGAFLVVILAIGAVILVVLNIFNVRERKYEIGVLTAMGMKKGKVALQFLTESFIVTLLAVAIGVGAGGVSSVPVTNVLLENQVAAQQAQSSQIEMNFGRGGYPGGGNPMLGGGSGFLNAMLGTNEETAYVTEISSAMNLTVAAQMLAIGIALTLVSGAVSMLFVMRYDPLKILANRD